MEPAPALGTTMKSKLAKRTIFIGRCKTSVNLEDEFWNGLKNIARDRQPPFGPWLMDFQASPRRARRTDRGVSRLVKWYNVEKGFGFVAADRGGKDVFVHATTLDRSGLSGLPEGQRVRMQISQWQKGPEARSIEPLD